MTDINDVLNRAQAAVQGKPLPPKDPSDCSEEAMTGFSKMMDIMQEYVEGLPEDQQLAVASDILELLRGVTASSD